MKNEEIQFTYEHAVALHQAGNHLEARRLYRKLLCWIPATPSFYGLMGTSHAQNGEFTKAVRDFGRLVVLEPHLASSQLHLANSLRAVAEDDWARRCYSKATVLEPSNVEALLGVGYVDSDAGKLEMAQHFLRRCRAIEPLSLPARIKQSQLLTEKGLIMAAAIEYEKIILLEPRFIECYLGKGNALYQLNRPMEACNTFRRAIALDPLNASIKTNAGSALQRMDEHDEAIQLHRSAILVQPDFPAPYLNMGNAQKHLMHLEDALGSYSRAIHLDPAYTDAQMNRGSILYDLKRYEPALESYDECIAQGGQAPAIWTNRGLVLVQLGRHEEAMESHERALALDRNHIDAQFNRSVLKLLVGDYETGWPDFEIRFKLPAMGSTLREPLPNQLPALKDLKSRRVMVYHEQGLGDVLQFCRYAPLLVAHGADVTLDVQEGLVDLLKTLGQEVHVVSGVDRRYQSFDLTLPIMSLPRLFKTRLETVPSAIPYLRARNEAIIDWHKRLAGLPRPLIGLVWAGGFRTEHPELWAINERRNIRLDQLQRLSEINATFVSLQKGEYGVDQLRLLKNGGWNGPTLIDHTNELETFADTAALIENLDLVIAVDTSTAHLAGAMGKDLWLLNRFDTCWRWGVDRVDSPWYPSAHIYRQNESRNWQAVIDRVVDDLKARYGAIDSTLLR